MINEFVLTSGAVVRINDAGREHGQIRAFSGAAYDPDAQPADRRPAQRGLRPHHAHPRRRHAGPARVHDSEPDLSRRQDVVQRHRRDSGHRQGRRSRHARRPPRLVALRHGRDGQRDRLRRDDGSRAHPAGDRRQAAADDSRRALGRRGAGPARDPGPTSSSTSARPRIPKPEFAKFNGYFNVDGGTGRIRGGSIFGPPGGGGDPAPGTSSSSRISACTARSARSAGRPAAPTARRSTPPACRASAWARTRSSTARHTWHTNLDTIERIVEEDVKKSAVAIASAVYHVAMREQMLPRFAPDKMPAPPAPAGRGGGAPAGSQR